MSKQLILESWKEIADFLNKDIRTCQRWERELGLPIHRLEGSAKARVFAHPEEIEVWLKEKYQNQSKNNLSLRGFFTGKLKYLMILVFLIGFAVTAMLLGIFKQISEPHSFNVQGSRLVILDEKGELAWDFDTGIENLASDEHYKIHFQSKAPSPGSKHSYNQPYVMFADLDHNGTQEVLFSIQTQDEVDEGKLYCFNNQGKILWTYNTGRPLQFGGKSYSQAFRIHGLRVKDWDQDGKDEILVISNHFYRFPCQITLLDLNGLKKGEYWHSGYLKDYEFIDLDQNGQYEIILAGMNNEWNTPVCLVLDPSHMQGTSPQSENEYILQDMEKGNELYYLRFPRNIVDRLTAFNNTFSQISLLAQENKIVLTSMESAVIYTLDLDLKLEKIVLTHRFKRDYQSLLSEGKISTSLEKIEQDILALGIQYLLPPDLAASQHKP